MPKLEVRSYMSTAVQTIDEAEPMLIAHRLVRQSNARHLPVLQHGKVVGMLSERDLSLLEAVSDVDPRQVAVSRGMARDPYVVSPETPLREVVTTLAEGKCTAAIVCSDDTVVGLFTAADACKALAALLTPGPQR